MEFLEAMQAYWTRAPDPKVPILADVKVAIDFDSLQPFVRGKELINNDPSMIKVRIADDRLLLEGEGVVAIDHDDHVEKLPTPPPKRVHPKHPDWKPVDADPGARSVWLDPKGTFVADDGKPLAPWVLGVWWSHAYADGRVVAVVGEGTLETKRMIYEMGTDGSLKKAPFSFGTSLFNRSQAEEDGFIIYKRVESDENAALPVATVEVLDPRLGAAAKPLVLGPIDRPIRGVKHTYGACKAKTAFIDMDPSFAVYGDGEWKYLPFDGPLHRSVSCAGDVLIVTEWPPLEIKRCTKNGCTKLSFPTPSILEGDQFAADEHHLFRVFGRDRGLGADIYDLDKNTLLHRVPLSDARIPKTPTELRVVAGRAIALFETADDWSGFSIDAEGKARPIQ